jgi:hypothetical protein
VVRNSAFTHTKKRKEEERRKEEEKRKRKKTLSFLSPSLPLKSSSSLLGVRALLLAHADDDVDEATVVLDTLHGTALFVCLGEGGGEEEKVSAFFFLRRRSRERKTDNKNQATHLGELLLVLLGDLRGLAADLAGTGERAVDFAC